MQKEVDTLWKVVNRLKEAENRVYFGSNYFQILERYKCELKALAYELKSSDEKSRCLHE